MLIFNILDLFHNFVLQRYKFFETDKRIEDKKMSPQKGWFCGDEGLGYN